MHLGFGLLDIYIYVLKVIIIGAQNGAKIRKLQLQVSLNCSMSFEVTEDNWPEWPLKI